MNTDREIVCLSTGQDPNTFQVKFPKNIAIHPNSEIGLIRGKVSHNWLKNLDETNNQMTLIYGGYNMDQFSNNTYNSCNIFTPEQITLKNGPWSVRSLNGDTAGDVNGFGYGSPNILTNLVDSINEQTKYFNIQWAGEWASSSTISIFPYIAFHEASVGGWKPALIKTNSITLGQGTNPGPGNFSYKTLASAGLNNGDYLAVSDYCQIQYSYTIMASGVANKPQYWHHVVLPTQAAFASQGLFGGIILAQQEDYKNEANYDPERDWVKMPVDANGNPDINGNLMSNMPFSWELVGTKIMFYMREIIDGKCGNIIMEQDSGLTYDGTTARNFAIRPVIADDAINKVTKLSVQFLANGVVVSTVDLEETFDLSPYRLRHAICNRSNATVRWTGLDKSSYTFLRPDLTLGKIDTPTNGGHIGTINIGMFMDIVKNETIMQLGPDTECNLQFEERTEKNNLAVLRPAQRPYYFIRSNQYDDGAQFLLTLNANSLEDVPDFHVCVDNLPIEEFLSNGTRGLTCGRIYSHYEDSNAFTEILEPDNIIYHKLHNKQTIMLDHLRIRITDNENAIYQELTGTTMLNIHIRTNPHRMLQELTGAIRSMSSKKETVDNTEVIQRASEFVF